MAEKPDKYKAFFQSYSDSEELLDVRMAHETIGEKRPVISTGSLVLDDALSSGGLPKGRLIQYYGESGCHAKGQKILLSDGTTKNVEDIRTSDLLVGDDSRPRKVLRLIRGHGKMYKVIPIKGNPFIINEDHILTLSKNYGKERNLIDVSLKEWLTWSSSKKDDYCLVRYPVIDFDNHTDNLPIDPYILGILIGDGTLQEGVTITTADHEIHRAFKGFVTKSKLRFVCRQIKGKTRSLRASGEKYKPNHIFTKIKKLGLNVRCENKFIPHIYKTSNYFNRLKILAGLMDTDGSLDHNCFDFISKSEQLSNDVAFVARSVGLAAYVKKCNKSAHKGHIGEYYRVCIAGNTNIIPTKIKRKKASIRRQRKNVSHTGFSVEYIGEDNFYGFTLSGNGRYLLDDFTVTHNSGKTLMSMIAISEAQKQDPEAQQVFIDAEQSFDPSWAEILGVDTSKVIIIDGELAVNGRQCFEMLLGVPKEDAKSHVYLGKKKEGLLDNIINGQFNINLIILDSLGMIIPPGEDIAVVGKNNMALMARFLTTTFRKLTLEINKAKVPFIIINHKKDTMDPYGPDHGFSGGNTYHHLMSAIVYFEAVQRKDAQILDEKENKIGHMIRATIEKSKFGPWPKKCEFKVNFNIGVVDKHEEIAQLAIDYNIINKPSTVTHEYGDKKWVGFNKFCDGIKEDPNLAEELRLKIIAARDNKFEEKRKEQEAKRAIVASTDINSDKVEKTKKSKKEE